jgi:hypothetical protein
MVSAIHGGRKGWENTLNYLWNICRVYHHQIGRTCLRHYLKTAGCDQNIIPVMALNTQGLSSVKLPTEGKAYLQRCYRKTDKSTVATVFNAAQWSEDVCRGGGTALSIPNLLHYMQGSSQLKVPADLLRGDSSRYTFDRRLGEHCIILAGIGTPIPRSPSV